MRATLLILFSIITLLSHAQESKKPVVLATASMWADMTEALAGDAVDVQLIVPIGGDPHIYETTPSDAIKIAKANLILKNGMTFEGWLNELIDNSGTKGKVVQITEGLQPISSTVYNNSHDPHAWMTAKNGLIYIKNIKDALIELVPKKKDEIEFNYGVYKGQLEALEKEIKDAINTIPKKNRILITSHDAFQYYGRHYGLELKSVLGTSTDADIQTKDVKELTDILRSTEVPAVFIETTVNPKMLKQLAADNHVVVGGSLYSDSLGEKDGPGGTYIGMLRTNTQTIVNALKKEHQKIVKEKSSNSKLLWLIPIALIFLGLLYFFLKKD